MVKTSAAMNQRPADIALAGALRGLGLVLGLALVPGCSIKQIAINKLGEALAQGNTMFASDDDPELVKAAAPFSLKLIESLLAESPRQQGLLLAACSGFTSASCSWPICNWVFLPRQWG